MKPGVVTFEFGPRERSRLYVALVRAQGDISMQLRGNSPDKKKLAKEYDDLEKIAKIIQRTFN